MLRPIGLGAAAGALLLAAGCGGDDTANYEVRGVLPTPAAVSSASPAPAPYEFPRDNAKFEVPSTKCVDAAGAVTFPKSGVVNPIGPDVGGFLYDATDDELRKLVDCLKAIPGVADVRVTKDPSNLPDRPRS